MGIAGIQYKIKSAGQKEIYLHLQECNNNFDPPLSEKIDMKEYSKKIFEHSITFEAWKNDTLSGLIAAYFNQPNHCAFITHVSVLQNLMKSGLASQLMMMCIEHASKTRMNEIQLAVNKNNIPAISFYKKFDFTPIDFKDKELVMKRTVTNSFVSKK